MKPTFIVQPDESTLERLERHARETGTTIESIVAEAVEFYAVMLDQFGPPHVWTYEDMEAVKEGLASLERGEGIPHEVVMAELRAKYGWEEQEPEKTIAWQADASGQV